MRLRSLYMLAIPVAALTQCTQECAPQGTDGPQFAQLQASEQVVPGDCDSYDALFAAYGLPVSRFHAIAWRESGCNHTSWVVDSDDLGGGLLGINFKTANLRNGWMNWCGAAPTQAFRNDANWQVRCAKEAYDRMGMAPWAA